MSSGGGGGGVPSQQTTISQVKLPDWVDESVQRNFAKVQELADRPYVEYGGPTLYGFTPDQYAAFQGVRDMAGKAGGQIGAALDITRDLPAATTSLLNPYMERVAGDVTSNMLRAAALDRQTLDANAAARHAFGGSRAEVADRLLGSETQRNIGQAVNKIASEGYTRAVDTALKQAGLIGNLAQAGERAGLMDAQALAAVGQQQQVLGQTGYAQDIEKWQQAQNWPYQQMAILQSALAGTPYGTTVQSAQPYNTNPAASAIGAATAGLGLLKAAPGAINDLKGLFNFGQSSGDLSNYGASAASYGDMAPGFFFGSSPVGDASGYT